VAAAGRFITAAWIGSVESHTVARHSKQLPSEDFMTNPLSSALARTPKHLWLIAVVATLWNSMGAVDYLMTQTKNAAYLKSFTPQQLDYFFGFPAWVISAWAIGVWGGVAGSLLLLFRKRIAAPVFLASVLGVIVTDIYNFGLTNGLEIMGGASAAIFPAVICAIAVALYLYARAMAAKGVLA
jgi:hypothetical protein